MYRNNDYTLDIKIDVPNGLYVFECESGIGKTRLFEYLRMLQIYGEPVKTFTYDDKKLYSASVESSLESNKYAVIMLDRYDMYNGDGAEVLKECAKNSIVLIDCKELLRIDTEEEVCFINMSENAIEVFI